MRITFSPRDEILDPAAVAGLGPNARALAKRLLLLSHEQLGKLRGAAGDGIVVALGEANDLPWADGVAYLGRDPEAPLLFVPTMLRPNVAMEVFERAIASRAARLPSPWAVLAAPPRLLSVADASAIDRECLTSGSKHIHDLAATSSCALGSSSWPFPRGYRAHSWPDGSPARQPCRKHAD